MSLFSGKSSYKTDENLLRQLNEKTQSKLKQLQAKYSNNRKESVKISKENEVVKATYRSIAYEK